MTQDTPRAVELAVSTVVFALRADDRFGSRGDGPRIWLPLVRRIRAPFDGQWALPGGPLDAAESLAASASRTLADTTGLEPGYLEQLYAFGDVGRSRGPRVVSIVYWALVVSDEARRARVGQNVRWFPADELPQLAFDHNRIVDYALWRMRTKMAYSSIARALLGETFTLGALREVYEAVLGRRLDPANFRRSMESSGQLIDTGERLTGTPHRPPRLYRFAAEIPTGAPGRM